MKSIDNAKKFLLSSLPPYDYLSGATLKTVRQGYLRKGGDCEMKVVEIKEKDEHFAIAKTPGPHGRETNKLPIGKDLFELLYRGTDGQQIFKRRYEMKDGDFILRFDEFLKETRAGMIVILEIDAVPGSAARPEDYTFPDEPWAKDREDVSGNPEYLNQNLAD